METAFTPNDLTTQVERLRARVDEYAYSDTRAEPPETRGARDVRPCPPPAQPAHRFKTLDEARRMMPRVMREYLSAPDAREKLLLIKASPGVGKTTAAVAIVEAAAEQGLKIGYAGPRHDFFLQVMEKAERPDWWYEWLPRQEQDEARGRIETCRYTPQIGTWLHKGYSAMDFCSGVCGWNYVNNGCPYHAQKSRRERIIFIQHPHITLGHPMDDFDILIGDESPVTAFLNDWTIPQAWIYPQGLDAQRAIAGIMHTLGNILSVHTRHIEGEELINELGGPEHVLAACDEILGQLSAAPDAANPRIHRADEAETVPYFHLYTTALLLRREAKTYRAAIEDGRAADPANQGRLYPHRVYLHNGELHLLTRNELAGLWQDKPVIWLDATGEPRIYEELFERRIESVDVAPEIHGRIYQVTSRGNGKTAIIDPKTGAITRQGQQLEEQIRRIVEMCAYSDPVVISFQKFVEQSQVLARWKRAHFYAARGTNEFENCDAVIIAGLPQPAIPDIARAAKMIFYNRDTAFRWREYTAGYVQFPGYVEQKGGEIAAAFGRKLGQGCEIEVGNFWSDPDLMAVLKMFREDEILQAAHRGRPVNRPVDIWLLLNAPVAGLPPDELMSIVELVGAPLQKNAFKYAQVRDLFYRIYQERIEAGLFPEQAAVTREDLITGGISEKTAREYYDCLRENEAEREVEKRSMGLIPLSGRGRKKRGLIPGERGN